MKVARDSSGRYVVDAVVKALDILDAFDSSDGLTLSQIRQQVGLNKSRIFRLLYTLAERGYVERSPDGARYKLGTKLLERAANVHRNLKDLARGSMLQLQERFNETVNLGVLDDAGHVLYVDIVESSRPFRMIASVGCRTPSLHTAMGKALLAYLYVDDSASEATAAETVANRPSRAIYRELALIRERGYAIDKEENEPGVGCIGVPILNAMGHPAAAMSVSGPVHRIFSNEKEISAALMEACERMSRALGCESRPRAIDRTATTRPTRAASVGRT